MPYFAAITLPPVLAGFLADAKDFLAALRFARPGLLWLLWLLTVFWILDRIAARRRRKAVVLIGRPAAVAGQVTHPVARQRLLRLAHWFAWGLLVFGVAGPRWGKSDETGVAVGRDLVVVIDVSRSMLADDMADRAAPRRWEAARNAALDLIDGLSRRGGHRVAVVLFAARPKVICPLTTDYEHARAVVEDIDPPGLLPDVRPAAGTETISGTRIGVGLIAAVKAHDVRYPGYQDCVLISDGDDPGDDKEWVRGADAARQAGIPVHVVGVGNHEAGTIVEVNEEPVLTQLQEAPLKQIAAETRGQYLAARRAAPRLGDFFRANLEPLPSRNVSDESIPLPKERYAWFLVPALALFALCWLRGK